MVPFWSACHGHHSAALLHHLGIGRTPPRDQPEAFRLPQLLRRRDLLCPGVPRDSRTVVSLRRAAPIIAWLFLFACRPRLPIYDLPFRAARRDHPRVVPEIRRSSDRLFEFPRLCCDHDVDRPIRQDRLFRSDRIADDLFRPFACRVFHSIGGACNA